MRIDFSRLENNHISPRIANEVLSNSLSNPWKNSLSNLHENETLKPSQSAQPTLTFSVEYPFEINRSLSPSSLKKCLDYLQAKKELPSSTLKFIKKSLDSEMEKDEKKQQKAKYSTNNERIITEKEHLDHVSFIEQSKKQKKISCCLNKIKSNRTIGTENTHNKYAHIKPRVYEPQVNKLRSQKYRKQPQLDQVTLKPMLNYTMNSKTSIKVNKKRNQHFKTCQINVFQSLYNDASLYATKRQMEKAIIQEESVQPGSITQRQSRVKVNSTFEERLQSSIEKVAQRKKKAQNKLEFDPDTGRRYFLPDTNRSKQTFKTHFKSQKLSILPPQQTCFPARGAYYSKDSDKMNRSQEMTTTLNNSYEKDLSKSLDGKYPTIRKPIQKENKLAELYAQLLWSQNYLKEQSLSNQQKKVFFTFLKDIQRYLKEHHYSKNINRQVFIALFKDFYASLNLFDRSILEERYKRMKKQEKEFNQNKHLSILNKSTERITSGRKNTAPNIEFYHTQRHYFI